MPNDAISGILNFIVYLCDWSWENDTSWIFAPHGTPATETNPSYFVFRKRAKSISLYEKSFHSLYEFELRYLLRMPSDISQKTKITQYNTERSSCAIAISKWKRKNKQIRTETHNETYVNFVFNNCVWECVYDIRAKFCLGVLQEKKGRNQASSLPV